MARFLYLEAERLEQIVFDLNLAEEKGLTFLVVGIFPSNSGGYAAVIEIVDQDQELDSTYMIPVSTA